MAIKPRPKRFADFTAAGSAAAPELPLAHTMDWWAFREVMDIDGLLRPEWCDVYKEDILYLYYGKPCFRPNSGVDPTSLSSFHLISILFSPNSAEPLSRVLPFDSGALAEGLYGPSVHPKLKLADFDLGTSLEAARKVVDRFYGSNALYYRAQVRSDLTSSACDIEIESFLSIIRTPAQTAFDDRRSAIEIQLRHAIDLVAADVVAVILPEQLLDDPVVEDMIKVGIGAKPLGYYCPHARPVEDARAIMVEAQRFYRDSGWL